MPTPPFLQRAVSVRFTERGIRGNPEICAKFAGAGSLPLERRVAPCGVCPLGCAHPLAPRPLELSRERRWVYMIGGGSYPLWRVLALTHRWLSRQRLTEELTASYQRELEDRLAQEKSRRMQLQEELFLAQHMDSIGRLAGDFSGHLDRKRADRLGLTMVQGIASRESGEIAAANLDGIGSRFRVYLPAARGDDP